MTNLALILEPTVGHSIQDCIKDAIFYSKLLGIDVVFTFNGVRMRISKEADIEEYVERYHKGLIKKI